MVLLTSSAVSAAISGGIVCTFTFLLFLSGYVLQQQTVRSLQDALRNPPDRVAVPTPTLPPHFQTNPENELPKIRSQNQIVVSHESAKSAKQRADEALLGRLWHEYIYGPDSRKELEERPDAVESADNDETLISSLITSKESLAYIFTLADTSSLCSAVLFVKMHKSLTRLARQPSLVFIYPATWDVSDKEEHMTAMDILRDLQDDSGVTLHPVTISRVWAGISTQQQLLAELQRIRWPYNRALYLASPGMLINVSALDEALAVSDIKNSWTLLHPSPKSYEASHPSFLFWAAGRGLLYPRHDMKRLAPRVSISHDVRKTDERTHESDKKLAGYAIFDEKELERRDEVNGPRARLFDQFKRERREVCLESGLSDF